MYIESGLIAAWIMVIARENRIEEETALTLLLLSPIRFSDIKQTFFNDLSVHRDSYNSTSGTVIIQVQ